MSSQDNNSLWVFGYGSLIWRPGFKFLQSQKALLSGAHRCLCVYSHHYRGTKASPGLVFGLLRGGSCYGMAFEVAQTNRQEVIKYLRKREQVSNVYCEKYRNILLASGEKVKALTYFANTSHKQFAGRLELNKQLELVGKARGEMGSDFDYVINTEQHLVEMGISDKRLQMLSQKLQSQNNAIL